MTILKNLLFYSQKNTKYSKGFTIIEVILSVAILSSIGFVIATNYIGFYRQKQLDLDSERLVSLIHNLQQKAISGENDASWGIYVVNNVSDPDWYEIYYGTSRAAGTLVNREYLGSSTNFAIPGGGGVLELQFTRISGIPNFISGGNEIRLQLVSNNSSIRRIIINTQGSIEVI